MNAPVVRVAIVVGLPANVVVRLQARFRDSVLIKSVLLSRKGGFGLETDPVVAAHMVEQFADLATTYEQAAVISLPYHATVGMVDESVAVLHGLGARVYTAPPDDAPWPKVRSKFGMDAMFQDALVQRITACVDDCFPPEPIPVDEIDEVKFELLRGLASHDKMGPNNHSHEDDLWKSRAQGWGSREREAIVRELMAAGLLDRKKNKSAGGKGWVYWIADVKLACATYPKLIEVIG